MGRKRRAGSGPRTQAPAAAASLPARASVFWLCARAVIGGLLAVSGFEKLVGPYQNFAYVIEQYRIVGTDDAVLIAQTLPWAELVVGVFLILGLWIRAAALGALAMFAVFLVVVGQALARRLPMDECGCFGELVSIPPAGVFGMDLVIAAVLVAGLLRRPGFTARSVDALYDRR